MLVSEGIENIKLLLETPLINKLEKEFTKSGYEISIVGGSVRDALLNREITDIDLTTNATPDEIVEIIKPISSKIWDIGKNFGTISANINGHKVEITTYRSDFYSLDSRKPKIKYGKSIIEDLKRRDFRMNAMAIMLGKNKLIDPYGGFEDIILKKINTPGKPKESFLDDPLRMLRAIRFSAQLNFDISEEVLSSIEQMKDRLEIISIERIRDEFNKLLISNNPRIGINSLVDTQLIYYIFPEVISLFELRDEKNRHKDVYEHSLKVLEQSIDLYETRKINFSETKNYDSLLVIRLASLLHDVAKPNTRKFEQDGTVSFHHHDIVGSKIVKRRLKELKYDNDTVKAVSRLVELHLRFFGCSNSGWSDSAVRRYVKDAGEYLELLHILVQADVTTKNKYKALKFSKEYKNLENRIIELKKQEELDQIRPELDGEEIMKILNILPGPNVGRAYKYLLDIRLDKGVIGKKNTEFILKEWAKNNGINTH